MVNRLPRSELVGMTVPIDATSAHRLIRREYHCNHSSRAHPPRCGAHGFKTTVTSAAAPAETAARAAVRLVHVAEIPGRAAGRQLVLAAGSAFAAVPEDVRDAAGLPAVVAGMAAWPLAAHCG